MNKFMLLDTVDKEGIVWKSLPGRVWEETAATLSSVYAKYNIMCTISSYMTMFSILSSGLLKQAEIKQEEKTECWYLN